MFLVISTRDQAGRDRMVGEEMTKRLEVREVSVSEMEKLRADITAAVLGGDVRR